MSLKDLVHKIALHYPGGIAPLAARMKPMDAAPNWDQVLRNKLNPNNTTHHLKLDEFEELVELAGANVAVADYFAAKENAVVIRIPECKGSDEELLDAFMDVVKELGAFSAEFQRDWADGRITPAEFRRLTKEAARVQANVLSFMARVEQLVDKPQTHLHIAK